MNELRALARYNKLLAPFLWVGPTAPGLKRGSSGSSSSRSGEQPDDDTVWSYSLVSAGMARERSMDVLGMYNATVQAESFDGLFYGEEVALLQAMMVGLIFFVLFYDLCWYWWWWWCGLVGDLSDLMC